MDYALAQKWNNVVREDDLVLHLGDFVWKPSKHYVNELTDLLNGHKILVRGNHDRHQSCAWWKENGFDSAFDSLRMGSTWFTHEPLAFDESEVRYWPKARRAKAINYHGHIHDKVYAQWDKPMYKCVSVERTHYEPVLFEGKWDWSDVEGFVDGKKVKLGG